MLRLTRSGIPAWELVDSFRYSRNGERTQSSFSISHLTQHVSAPDISAFTYTVVNSWYVFYPDFLCSTRAISLLASAVFGDTMLAADSSFSSCLPLDDSLIVSEGDNSFINVFPTSSGADVLEDIDEAWEEFRYSVKTNHARIRNLGVPEELVKREWNKRASLVKPKPSTGSFQSLWETREWSQ